MYTRIASRVTFGVEQGLWEGLYASFFDRGCEALVGMTGKLYILNYHTNREDPDR